MKKSLLIYGLFLINIVNAAVPGHHVEKKIQTGKNKIESGTADDTGCLLNPEKS